MSGFSTSGLLPSGFSTSAVSRKLVATITLVCALSLGCRREPPDPFDAESVHDPLTDGPYGVIEEPFGRAMLFLPTTTWGIDRALPRAPLVVFLPGFTTSPVEFHETARALARHGIAVFTVDHGFGIPSALLCETQASGLRITRDVLFDLEKRVRTISDPLFDRVDVESFAAVGHSYGGKLAFWLALEDPRVTAVVGLDPVDGGDERRTAWCVDNGFGFPDIAPAIGALEGRAVLLFLAGQSGECAPVDGNASVFFAHAPSGTRLVQMEDATHTDFLDAAGEGNCTACGFCPETATDPVVVKAYTRARLVAFLKGVWRRDVRYLDLALGVDALAEAPFDALVDESVK